jgi:hypothetical protein
LFAGCVFFANIMQRRRPACKTNIFSFKSVQLLMQ